MNDVQTYMPPPLFIVELTYPPSQNHAIVPTVRKSATSKSGYRGAIVHTKEANDWNAEAENRCAKAHGLWIAYLNQPVCLYIEVFPPHRRGDADNLVKKVQDALQGHAYFNDRQVRRIIVDVDDTVHDPPRVVARVWEMGRAPEVYRSLDRELLPL